MTRNSSTRPSSTTALLLATAVAVLFLGAGCKKEQPTPAPAPIPTPAPAASAPAAPEPGAGLIAPAPLGPPPPDIPSVPTAPPTAADAVAPAPLPSSSRELAPSGPAEEPPSPGAAGPRVIRVTAKQWEWQPREIRIRKDERVVLAITNVDIPHGIIIPELNVNEVLPAGRTTDVTFVATKVGRFDFACSVFCGQGHSGMRGTLVVEE